MGLMERGEREGGGGLPAAAAAAAAGDVALPASTAGAAGAAGAAGETRRWRPDRAVGMTNGRREKQRLSVARGLRGVRGVALLLALCLASTPVALPASFSHCKDECYNWASPSRGLCQASQKPNAPNCLTAPSPSRLPPHPRAAYACVAHPTLPRGARGLDAVCVVSRLH